MSDFASGYTGEQAPFMGGVSGLYPGSQDYGTDGGGGEGSDLKKGPSFLEYQKKEAQRALGMRKLVASTFFCFCFMCAEIVGGFVANSLAIMTDAAHLMSDLSAFGISILAIHLARRAKTKRMSFGSGRAEVIGAVTSIVIIWLLTVWLIVEAVDRTLIIVNHGKLEVNGKLMTIVAALGILVNLIMFAILGHSHGPGDHSHGPEGDADGGHSHGGHGDGGHSHSHGDGDGGHGGHSHGGGSKCKGGHSHGGGDGGHGGHGDGGHSHGDGPKKGWEDWFIEKLTGGHSHGDAELNVRAALVHVIGDFVQSLGVLAAAIVIWIWPWAKIADPACTFLFSILVFITTVPVMKDSLLILLETVPKNCTEDKIVSCVRKTPGVLDVVDIHCWQISQGVTMLVCHIKPRDTVTTSHQCFQLVDSLRKRLYDQFGFHHCTIEIDNQWLIEQQTCFFAFGSN